MIRSYALLLMSALAFLALPASAQEPVATWQEVWHDLMGNEYDEEEGPDETPTNSSTNWPSIR